MSSHRKPIDKLMDCQHVKRWTMVGTTVESTVASHSFNVAMIAMAIFKRMRNIGDATEEQVCYFALLHDVDEAETGDMPTPTKKAIRKAGVEPNGLYCTQGLVPPPCASVAAIIKMADLVENYIFIKEHGTGARARWAVSDVRERLDGAMATASGDLARAAHWVMDYIERRRSDEEQERADIKEATKRHSYLVPLTMPSVVDREPRNSLRGS